MAPVLVCRKKGDQVEFLEDIPDRIPAHMRPLKC